MVAAQEVEALAVVIDADKARLGVGQLRSQLGEQRSQLQQGRLGLRLRAAQDDEVVGIPDEHAEAAVAVLPRSIQRVG